MPSRRRLTTYRKRLAKSHCRTLRGRTCKKTKGCKYASGTKRRFCRKTKNTRLRRRSTK